MRTRTRPKTLLILFSLAFAGVAILFFSLGTPGRGSIRRAVSDPIVFLRSLGVFDQNEATSTAPKSEVIPGPEVAPGPEVKAKRTLTSKTYATTDPKKFQTKIYSGPIHFKDASGQWSDIKTAFVPGRAGRFKNSANSFGLDVAASQADPILASVTIDDTHSIGFRLDGARSGSAAPDGANITYRGVRPSVDLEFVSVKSGLKETLLLRSKEAQNVFVFPLMLQGLDATIDASGAVIYRDEAGVQRAMTPPGTMEDSNYDERKGESARTDAVSYELIAYGEGGQALKVTLDRAWLDDPARVYPVMADPTSYIGDGREGGGSDAFVMSAYPNNTYNSSCCAGDPARYEDKIGYYDSSTGTNWSYFYYELSSLNGKQIAGATWYGYFIHSYYPSTQTLFRLQPSTCCWNASSVTWNNKPLPGPETGDGMGVKNQWSAVPITSWIQNFTNGTWQNNGIKIDTGGQGQTSWKKIAANENSGGVESHITVDWTESNQDPIGSVDAISSPSEVRVNVGGWALDPDTSDSIHVHIYIDGNLIAGLNATGFRPDVGLAYPGYGDYHGFDGTYPAAAGDRNVCVYAINTPVGNNPLLRCQVVTVAPDTTPPAAPVITSTTHNNTDWSASTTAAFNWEPPADASTITGYSVTFTASPTTQPPQSVNNTSRTWTQNAIADGEWYLHVSAVDSSGNWGPPGRYLIRVDSTGPTSISVNSLSHPSQTTWYPNQNPSFTWSASDTSGVSEYSYAFDASASTVPDTQPEGTMTSASYSGQASGTWWFHLRAKNGAGVWSLESNTVHYQVRVDVTLPTAPEFVVSDSHSVSFPNPDPTIDVKWTSGFDAHSGVRGYSWTFNQTSSVSADTTSDGNVRTYTSQPLSNGSWWFHVRTIDIAGNAGPDVTLGPLVVNSAAIVLPEVPVNTFGDEPCNPEPDYYDTVGCSAPPDPLAPLPVEELDGYRALYGYVGPYYSPLVSGSGVRVLSPTVFTPTDPATTWGATGLIRNETSQPIANAVVTARLYGAGDLLLAEVSTTSPVSPVRVNEPAPFTLKSSVANVLVARVEYTTQWSGAVSISRQLKMSEYWYEPYGDRDRIDSYIHMDPPAAPFPYIVAGSIRNQGSLPVASPAVVGAWFNGSGQLIWVQSVDVVGADGLPLVQLDAGMSANFELVVADPTVGPKLNEEGQFIYWGVPR